MRDPTPVDGRAGKTPSPAARGSGQVASLGVAGIGRILMWQGGSLWIGRDAGHSHLHAHHAIQVTIALDEPEGAFLLRDGPEGEWARHEAAMVRPHHRHEFDGRGRSVAHLFVEPETACGRALIACMNNAGVTGVPMKDVRDSVAELRLRWRARMTDDELVQAGCDVIQALCGSVPASAATSPRIAAALAFIASRIAHDLSLSQVAAAVNLSPSRLRHLFVEEVGTSYRGYVLWRRLLVAADAMMTGRTWTEAAHEAGFADSAHLSRTFRRTFGISPRMLIREAPAQPGARVASE